MWLDVGGKCCVQNIFKVVEEYHLQIDKNFDLNKCLSILRRMVNIGHIVCIGCIPNGDIDKTIDADINSWPYSHLRSRKCLIFLHTSGCNVCMHCKQLSLFIRRSIKRKAELMPVMRSKRTRITSKCRIDFLTPKSRRKRLQSASKFRDCQRKKIITFEKKLADHDVTISEEHSQTMKEVVDVIESKYSSELNAVIDNEINSESKKQLLRRVWQRDVNNRKIKDIQDFRSDQRSNKLGFRGNRWSAITLRLAMAVYSRSPAAHQALCKFGEILHLPSMSTIKDKMREHVHQPGINHEYMLAQQKRYSDFCDENLKQGKKTNW